jgi:hypothetical protein
MTKRYPLFGLGLQGRSSNVTAQRRLNIFVDFTPEDDKTRVTAYGTPGLDLFVDFGDTPARGVYTVGNFMYVVHRGVFWEVNNAGVKVNRGTLLTTTGRVGMVDNGSVIQVVDGSYGYTYDLATNAFTRITDPDFVAGYTNAWQDGWFIKDRAGSAVRAEWNRFDISADGSAYDALDYAAAEANPDSILRVFTDHGELILFGENTLEFWGNSGAQDFPFGRLGSAVVEWGLAARWTVTKFANSLMFLAKNKLGQVQVVRLDGYNATPVSDPALEYIINGYSSVSDATAFSYLLNGHLMYQINFPTAGKSWLYDGTSNLWSELQSNGGRHLGEIGALYLNGFYVSDYATGKIYRINADSYTDNGTAIKRLIASRHVYGGDYVFISEMWADFETGVGLTTGQGNDPQVMLRISKDNGHTWGNEMWRSLGAIGKYITRARWLRLGRSRDWVFELSTTDPVKFVLTGAFMSSR